MSAGSASLYEPLEAIREREGEREEEKCKTENIKNGQRKETNTESGARHRIFGDGLRSMGSARVGCPMRFADGTLHQSVLGRL
jgi:hypothetical protein